MPSWGSGGREAGKTPAASSLRRALPRPPSCGCSCRRGRTTCAQRGAARPAGGGDARGVAGAHGHPRTLLAPWASGPPPPPGPSPGAPRAGVGGRIRAPRATHPPLLLRQRRRRRFIDLQRRRGARAAESQARRAERLEEHTDGEGGCTEIGPTEKPGRGGSEARKREGDPATERTREACTPRGLEKGGGMEAGPGRPSHSRDRDSEAQRRLPAASEGCKAPSVAGGHRDPRGCSGDSVNVLNSV